MVNNIIRGHVNHLSKFLLDLPIFVLLFSGPNLNHLYGIILVMQPPHICGHTRALYNLPMTSLPLQPHPSNHTKDPAPCTKQSFIFTIFFLSQRRLIFHLNLYYSFKFIIPIYM